MTYDTIIFDLDGTTLNTLEDLTDSLNYALNKCGFKERTIEQVRAAIGNGMRVLVKKSLPEDVSTPQLEQCLKVFLEYYEENVANKTCPYEGIMDMLNQLKLRGHKLAIVSNKFQKGIALLYDKFFKEYMPIAIGQREDIPKKPAPDSVYMAMEELGATKESTVYIGDSEVDYLTAKNAGIACILVTWGFRAEENLKELGADYIAHSTQEIIDIVS